MDSERWRRVEELFHAALAVAPEAQQALLSDACGNDADLRREVESLLARREQADSFLETNAPETVTARAALLGRQLGPYQILELLGAGGMGEVYRARDSKLNRYVALKTLPARFASDPERLARFRREARTLANLNHPNISMIHGLEEFDGATFLVLELVEGETLRGPLPIGKALDYARQIADAVESAHGKGVIHRDLKPTNIKVTPENRVKVLDFGLAKAVWGRNETPDLPDPAPEITGDTLVGQIVGSPRYMSPEQTRGENVDRRTDIWAFGCVLYELLTDKLAFRGETLPETMAAVLEREPDWSALPPETPARVRKLLRRCLEKDHARRLPDIQSVREEIAKVQRGFSRWQQVALATAVVSALGACAALYLRGPVRPVERSEWVQLTNFPDSVSQPALSSDGKMLTFVRGPDTFAAPGEIYSKALPSGEPAQLTRDNLSKMSPVFSPDGTQIAYTVVPAGPWADWDTWTVPLVNGPAQLWLKNASGLIWFRGTTLLFSEIKRDIHMGIVTTDSSRVKSHDVYLPANHRGMAHRSYPSADGRWAVLVEMDERGRWLPCRLVPLDGSSPGRLIGPSVGGCTFASFSPDGKWVYVTSSAGGAYHIWRQRFPDGEPEQITSGPTEEEGIAVAPDGQSLITAVALRQSVLYLHETSGDRQISREGFSYDAKFTPDGKKLLYRILKGVNPAWDPTELRVVDLSTGLDQSFVPGLQVIGPVGLAYDISGDGKQVAAIARDLDGKQRLWLADMERQSPPRQVSHMEARNVRFGSGGEIYFSDTEKQLLSSFTYRVSQNGTQLRKMLDQPAVLLGISPDRQWLLARLTTENTSFQAAVPLGGGPMVRINSRQTWGWDWSTDHKLLYVSVPESAVGILKGRTYVIPLSPGQALPRIPEGGFQRDSDLANLPGVRVIDVLDVAPGPAREVYAFSRASVQRNLYRIPLR